MPEQDVVVTVLEVRGDRVRIGIEAPANVRIHRQEIWERIQADSLKQRAVETVASA
jgi:carbon storage regulator